MSYKAGISAAIAELKDRNGSSMIAIKKFMMAALPAEKKWMNAQFLSAIKTGVAAGEFVQTKVRNCDSSVFISYSSIFCCILFRFGCQQLNSRFGWIAQPKNSSLYNQYCIKLHSSNGSFTVSLSNNAPIFHCFVGTLCCNQ